MAGQRELQKESSARTDDGPAGDENSNNILWPEKLKSLTQKVDSVIGLLQRIDQPGSEPLSSKQHELTLLERALHDFKAELNQMQHSLSITTEPPRPFSLAELNQVLSHGAHSQETEKVSTKDALQQAEHLTNYQRGRPELKESTQKSDGELRNANIVQHEQSKGNLAIPSNSQATSVVVGRGNTAVIQSTININVGENSDLEEFFKSLLLKLMPSVTEMLQKQDGSKISSQGATPKIAMKEPKQLEGLKSTTQYQVEQLPSSDTDKIIEIRKPSADLADDSTQKNRRFTTDKTKYLPEALLGDEFGKLVVKVSLKLEKRNCTLLATYFNLPVSKIDLLRNETDMPGLRLFQILKERNIIDMYNVSQLQEALAVLHLGELNETLVMPYQNQIHLIIQQKNKKTWKEH